MKIVLIVLAVLILLLLGMGYYVFASVLDTQFSKKDADFDESSIDGPNDLMRPTAKRFYAYRETKYPAYDALKKIEWTTTSFDGLKLKAQLVEGNPKEVVILVHGFKSSAKDDFCDRIEIYLKRGSTILLVDDRCHGKSEGRYIGFGELDRLDVAKWVDKVNETYDNPKIYLHGVSMGGATVIHCANMNLKNVAGIVDDCGFNSIRGITKALFKDSYHLPYFPIGYFAGFVSKLIAGIDFDKSKGEVCVSHASCPILFIHGTEDHYVPCWMSKQMHEACNQPKELVLIKGAGHAAAYMMDPKRYEEAVNRLLDGKLS